MTAGYNRAHSLNHHMTVNTTIYDIKFLFFICMCFFLYMQCIFVISLPLAICVVTAPVNWVTWSHGAIEMVYYYYMSE